MCIWTVYGSMLFEWAFHGLNSHFQLNTSTERLAFLQTRIACFSIQALLTSNCCYLLVCFLLVVDDTPPTKLLLLLVILHPYNSAWLQERDAEDRLGDVVLHVFLQLVQLLSELVVVGDGTLVLYLDGVSLLLQLLHLYTQPVSKPNDRKRYATKACRY